MKRAILYLPLLFLLFTCGDDPATGMETTGDEATPVAVDPEANVTMVPITTPVGDFEVYTRRVGDNPEIKLLLLHGGPGANSSYFESIDEYFPGKNIEYYYYDQLGSLRSDVPKDTSLWNIDRFVDEVEQVRQALNLTKDNFYILGHSWGGILGVEYALKYQDKMNGLIISNMMMDVPAYNRYAAEVLGPQLPPDTLAKIRAFEDARDYGNEAYLNSIYLNYYPKHVLRLPMEEWPDAVNRGFEGLNTDIYVGMQGPSEFGIQGDAKLRNWSRMADLEKINIPTLVVAGGYDTMDPAHMKEVSEKLPKGSYLLNPQGSHMSMWDDKDTYWPGIMRWLEQTEADGK